MRSIHIISILAIAMIFSGCSGGSSGAGGNASIPTSPKGIFKADPTQPSPDTLTTNSVKPECVDSSSSGHSHFDSRLVPGTTVTTSIAFNNRNSGIVGGQLNESIINVTPSSYDSSFVADAMGIHFESKKTCTLSNGSTQCTFKNGPPNDTSDSLSSDDCRMSEGDSDTSNNKFTTEVGTFTLASGLVVKATRRTSTYSGKYSCHSSKDLIHGKSLSTYITTDDLPVLSDDSCHTGVNLFNSNLVTFDNGRTSGYYSEITSFKLGR